MVYDLYKLDELIHCESKLSTIMCKQYFTYYMLNTLYPSYVKTPLHYFHYIYNTNRPEDPLSNERYDNKRVCPMIL